MILLTCGYSEKAAFKSRCVNYFLQYNLGSLDSEYKLKQQDEDCTWTYSVMDETVVGMKITNCDCSDPDNDDYFDEGRFKSFMIYQLFSANSHML